MQFQAYNRILICKEPMRPFAVEDKLMGYAFSIRYPSYRGTFLSCVEELTFQVDGEAIPAEAVRFRLGGKEYLLEQLPQADKAYWYVMDKAEILVLGDVPEAGEHTLAVHMKHRIPYAGYGGSYLTMDSDVTEVLQMEGGGANA